MQNNSTQKRFYIAGIIFIALISTMSLTGTLSYPYIMLDRQIQLISRCMFSPSSFDAAPFGYSILVPDDYCVLPHRMFPEDTSIQVVPKGFYFVFNEYAFGSIASASKASILFEPTTPERNKRTLPGILIQGGFASGSSITEEHTNGHDVPFSIVRMATGIEEGKRFHWAFTDNSSTGYTATILTADPAQPEVFESIIDGMSFVQ